MPKLICLMPTYNKEDTLAKAIESVMMQKTDFDYKLIILDDCSSDRSNEIAKEYQQKFPEKIDIVRNEKNLKLLYSIINGYKLLKDADYFCVLDADDYYTYDKKFSDAVEFLDKHKDYSMYMTNITFKQGDKESKYYQGDEKIRDFGFNERKNGKGLFIQTSGVIYRNLYFYTGENKKFENVVNSKFPQSYRADGFRYEWYLMGGKAHFVNHEESVYNYDMNGLWSTMSECEQNLNNAKMMYSCAEFFPEEKWFYYAMCKDFYKKAMSKTGELSGEVFVKNQDLITFLYEYLYISNDCFITKIMKFFISLIPLKNVRNLLRKSI